MVARQQALPNIANSRISHLVSDWSTNQISYSVFNPKEHEVVISAVSDTFIDLFDFTTQDFQRFIRQESIFDYSFLHHTAVVNTPYFTLIPNAMLQHDQLAQILSFNMALPSGKLFYDYCELPNTSYTIVYALPEQLVLALQEAYPSVILKCAAAVFLQQFTKEANNNLTIAFKQNDDLLIADFNDGELQFFNAFEASTPEDFVYHILNVYRQIGHHHEQRTIHLMGTITHGDEFYTLLKQYIPNINWVARPKQLQYDKHLKETPAHYFTHHYSLFV